MGMLDWISLLFGGVSTLGSLAQGRRAEEVARNAARPGGLPGTLNDNQDLFNGNPTGIFAIDNNPYVEQIRNQATTGAKYDPRVPGLFAYGAGRENSVLPILQGNVNRIENSGLTDIANRLSGETTRLQQNRDSTLARREESRNRAMTAGQGLQDRARDLTQRTDSYFSRVANDPTVVSQGEMDAIAGNIIANSAADYGARFGQLQSDAVARGRSTDATNAVGTLLGESQRQGQAQSFRDAYLANSIEGKRRADAAAELRGQLGGSLLGLEGSLAGQYDNIDRSWLDAITQADLAYTGGIGGLLGQEAGVRGNYTNMLNSAYGDIAGFHDQQSQIPMMLGDILAGRGDYNTLLESGAYNAAADRLGNVGGGLMNLGYSGLQADQMAQQQQDDNSWMWGLGGAFAAPFLGGAGYGLAGRMFGGANQFVPMPSGFPVR